MQYFSDVAVYILQTVVVLDIPLLVAGLTEVEDGSVKVGEGSGISHTTIGEYHGLLRCLGHFISGRYFNTGTSLLSTCWPAMGIRR